jgi:uncharacterized protein (TIGR04255 family)
VTHPRDELPEFDAPPITEAVLGIQFNPPANYHSIQAFQVWNLFKENFPVVQEMPPLPPQFETFGLPAMPFNFNFVMGAPEQSRFWFATKAGDQIIQFQRDRLLHNWRKVGTAATYPRFETILPSFRDEIEKLQGYARELGNERLSVNQAEISYINQIIVEEQTGPFEPQKWLSFIDKNDPPVDEFNIAARYVLRNPDGMPNGRLHRESATGTDPSGRRTFSLMFTVRGKPMGDTVDDALEFIADGRHMISKHFLRSTTPEAHKIWKRVR